MERKTHRQFLKKRANTVSARREWSNIVQMQMLQSTSCNNTNLRVFRMAININKHTQKNLKNSKVNKHGQKLYQQRNKLQIHTKKKNVYTRKVYFLPGTRNRTKKGKSKYTRQQLYYITQFPKSDVAEVNSQAGRGVRRRKKTGSVECQAGWAGGVL